MLEARFTTNPGRRVLIPEAGVSSLGQLPQGSVALVYGAPGSGKTTQLIGYHNRAILQGGLQATQVLTLAATRGSASWLRDQLLLGLGRAHTGAEGSAASDSAAPGSTADAPYAVEGALARTVSSLAFQLVRCHALANGLPEPELISGAEQDTILEALLAEQERLGRHPWPAHITPVTLGLSGFRAELRDLIAACQEHNLDAQALLALGHSRPEWRAAVEVFEEYEQRLASPQYLQRFDSPTLINRAIELVDSGNVSSDYRVILVDDAQELTPAAARLLRSLAGQTATVILFGDPDSTTLGFRQADPRILSSIANQIAQDRGAAVSVTWLPLASTVQSHAGVAAALRRVSALIPAESAGAQRRVHGTDKASSAQLAVHVFQNQQQEIDWLAFNLRSLHVEQSVGWADIAVVARTRAQLDLLERSLAAASVPVRITGAQHALRDEFASRELLELAAFCLLNRDIDAESAERLLRSPFCGLDSVALRRLRRQLRREELSGVEEGVGARNSDELLLELFANPAAATVLRGSDSAKIRRFLKSIEAARSLSEDPQSTIEDLLWELWSASKLADHWSEIGRGTGEVAVQANRNLDAIVALFAAANRFVERNPNGSKEDFLIAQLEQRLPEDSLALGQRSDGYVNLTTPAGLVGNRFHTVAIPALIEGIWPNLKPRNSLLNAGLLAATITGRTDESGGQVRSEMADELRMFYKAIGAANTNVLVSSFSSEDEQISQFVALASGTGLPEEEPFELSALTLRGLAGSLRRRLALESDPLARTKLAVNLGRLAEAGVPGAHPDDWYGLQLPSTDESLFEFVSEDSPAATTDPDKGPRITLNPSQLDAYLKCPLHWFLDNHGGSQGDYSASVGTLIHKAMELASSSDESHLWQYVETGWHSLKFESEWLEQAERRRAQAAVANLSKYLREFEDQGGAVLAREQEFELDLDRAHVRGKVDRIEQTAQGQVVIVDLKTGSRIPSIEDGKTNPQLGLYQLAFLNGAFSEVPIEPNVELGGAKLLLVGSPNKAEREQGSLELDPSARAYFETLVDSVANGMAMPERIFVAKVSSHCTNDKEFGSCDLHLRKAVSYVG